jgi:hypothetical protein
MLDQCHQIEMQTIITFFLYSDSCQSHTFIFRTRSFWYFFL